MPNLDRIEINPKVMMGKPVVKGTRIPVERIRLWQNLKNPGGAKQNMPKNIKIIRNTFYRNEIRISRYLLHSTSILFRKSEYLISDVATEL